MTEQNVPMTDEAAIRCLSKWGDGATVPWDDLGDAIVYAIRAIRERKAMDANCDYLVAECDATHVRAAMLEAALRALVDDITDLIIDSDGVAGLHRNGDLAPWSELTAGGSYERLRSLLDAQLVLGSRGGG